MTQPTKKQLIAKIVKEQGVDPKSLDRLNLEALKKMDLVVPDASDDDLLGGDPQEDSHSSTDTQPSAQSSIGQDESPSDVGGQSVPAQNGTGIVTPASESPSEESNVPEENASELSTTPSIGSGTDSGPVEEDCTEEETLVLGVHPVTGEVVRVCDQ